MSNIKTIRIPLRQVLEGSEVDDSMPAGWLATFIDRCKAAIPSSEWPTAKLRGAAGIYIEYQHALTREEVREERLARYEAARDELRALLPPDGETLSAENLAAIRRLLA